MKHVKVGLIFKRFPARVQLLINLIGFFSFILTTLNFSVDPRAFREPDSQTTVVAASSSEETSQSDFDGSSTSAEANEEDGGSDSNVAYEYVLVSHEINFYSTQALFGYGQGPMPSGISSRPLYTPPEA